MILRLLVLLYFLNIAKANITLARPCCEDDNLFMNRTCTSGKTIDLSCKARILVDLEDGEDGTFEINKDGQLIYPTTNYFTDDMLVDPTEYCITKVKTANSSIVAFICYEAIAPDPDHEKWFSLRAICGIISVLFLVATLVVYFLVPSLRDLQGICIMHNIGALALAMGNLSILQLTADLSNTACLFFGFCSYFAFMVAFFWLNVTSFQIWKTVVHPNIAGTDKQWYLLYLLYGYGMPVFFLIILLMAHHIPGSHLKPGIGVSSCWFNGLTETWAYFYGPITILLIMNIVMFVWCITKLWIERKTLDDLRTKSLKYKVRLYVKLFVVMGIMWVFEIISSVLENVHAFLDYVWIVTDYVNVLQGAYIFLLLVVLRKRALRGLANRGLFCLTFPSAWKNLDDEEIFEDDGETNLNAQL